MNSTQSNKAVAIVLVIDDNRTRDAIYKKFFALLSNQNNFLYEIRPIVAASPSEAINSLLAREPCLVVLDMMLDGIWEEHSDKIYEALSRTQCPMGLLSLDFNNVAASKSANTVLAKLRAVPKLGFWPYSTTIARYCEGGIENKAPATMLEDPIGAWNLIFQEALGHGRHWKPNTQGEVTFLHLTDTHFGKSEPDYLKAFAVNNGAKGNNNVGGAAALSADYLIWTGDITNTGLPSEFEQAKKFASDIKDVGLLPRSCPISIVPGNHDLCWPLALASRLALEDISSAEDSSSCALPVMTASAKLQKRWVVKNESINEELWEYGAQPFRDFYASLVEEPAPLTVVGFCLHTQWAHLGFAVLELPVEAHVVQSDTSASKPAPFVSVSDFKNITNNAIKSLRDANLHKDVCIVFLIHGRTPDQPEDWVERWTELVDSIEELGHATIIFGGHEHAAAQVLKGRRLTIVGVPHDLKNTAGSQTLPGVGFIRLSGLGTKRLRCEITKVQLGGGHTDRSKWRQVLPPTRYEIAAADPHPWAHVTAFSLDQ